MTKISSFLTFFLFVFSLSGLNAQIKIRELNPSHSEQINVLTSSFSTKRAIIPLDKNWMVYEPGNSEQKAKISIPSSFEGADELTYENEFRLTSEQITNNIIYLNTLGIGNNAKFVVNDNIIQNIRGGEIPSRVLIPEDLIYSDATNILQIDVSYKLDNKTTIPLRPRFLSPKHTAGIFRSVYFELVPKRGFNNLNIIQNNSGESDYKKLIVEYNANSPIVPEEKTEIVFSLLKSTDKTTPVFTERKEISSDLIGSFEINYAEAELWSPETPNYYIGNIQLLRNGIVVDEINKNIAFYSVVSSAENLLLNGNTFDIRGVNYNLNDLEKGSMISYEKMKTRLQQIKTLGFNTVKFNKTIPHPFALEICLDLGLFSVIEMPLCSMPEKFATEEYFIQIVNEYILNMIKNFGDNPSVLAIGVGNGYLANSPIQMEFVTNIGKKIKTQSNKLVFASFTGLIHNLPKNIDFAGMEIYSNFPENLQSQLEEVSETIGNKKIFFSNLIYPAFIGSTNGYSNINSFEAQAKFYERAIDLVKSAKLAGLFFGSMYDYQGEYSSLYAGPSENSEYKIGIMDISGKADRITYKVIDSKFNNSEKVIIPLGTFKEESPFFFIIMSLVLSIALAVLINSKRKFREDASRALLRPYNFYADIRDKRILSGIHSVTLTFILGATHALLFTILFYFFRTNILIEKILLTLGNEWIINLVSSLAWNPIETFLKLYLLAMLMFLFMSVFAKFASFFVKNRITFSSIFIVVIWSFLPVVVLLPLELILYKVLVTNVINPYLYALFIVFAIWLFQRLLKGLYVIFDVPAVKVYFYGFLLLFLFAGSYVLYQQYYNSAIYFIINAYKQYTLM